MDNAFVQEMKTALEAEKAKIDAELKTVSNPDVGDHVPGENAPKFPDFGDDTSDEAASSPAEVAEYEVNIDVTQKLQQRLKDITDALAKIENGTYGKDEQTGEMIPEERLRANPAAREAVK